MLIKIVLIEVDLIKDVVKRLNQQKSINVQQEVIKSSDHFFTNIEIKVIDKVKAYCKNQLIYG